MNRPELFNGGTLGWDIIHGNIGWLYPIGDLSLSIHIAYDPHRNDFSIGGGPTAGVGAGPYGGWAIATGPVTTNAPNIESISGWGWQVTGAIPFVSVTALSGSNYVGCGCEGGLGGSGGIYTGPTYSWYGWYSTVNGWGSAPLVPPFSNGSGTGGPMIESLRGFERLFGAGSR